MQLFAQLVQEGKTVVMVTHERDYSRYFTRSILLVDGVISTSCVPELTSNVDDAAAQINQGQRYA